MTPKSWMVFGKLIRGVPPGVADGAATPATGATGVAGAVVVPSGVPARSHAVKASRAATMIASRWCMVPHGSAQQRRGPPREGGRALDREPAVPVGYSIIHALTPRSLVRGVKAVGARDAHLAAVVDRFGPPPLWARPPGFATLVRIILEQQVSLASGRAAYTRLQAAAGRVTPSRVAGLSESRFRRHGLTRQKARYCRDLAARIVNRELSLERLGRLDDDAVRAGLVEVTGIGRWTADIYLLMALRRPDVWPVGDLALVKSAQQVKRMRSCPSQEKLRRIARAWAPWRAVAARILWHAYLSSRAGVA